MMLIKSLAHHLRSFLRAQAEAPVLDERRSRDRYGDCLVDSSGNGNHARFVAPSPSMLLMRYRGEDHLLDAEGIIAAGKLIDSLDERLAIMGEALKKERRRCADVAVALIARETGYSPSTWQFIHDAIMADPHHNADAGKMVELEPSEIGR